MRGLETRSRTSRSRSQSRLLWQSLGLVSKSEPDLGLGGYGLDYVTVVLLFACVNFVVTPDFMPCLGFSIFQANLVSNEKCAAGKVGLNLPKFYFLLAA